MSDLSMHQNNQMAEKKQMEHYKCVKKKMLCVYTVNER